MSDENTTRDKLREMGRLTVLSNRVSEVQEKNMRLYPFVFFDGVSTAQVDFDLERKKTANDEVDLNNSLVSYYLTVPEKHGMEHLPKRFQAIEQATRLLFWADVKVEVYFNGDIVFKSKKK